MPLPSTVIGGFFSTMGISDFLPPFWFPIAFLWFGFHTPKEGNRTSAVPITYLSSASPSSQTGGRSHFLTMTAMGVLSAVDAKTSTKSNLIIISQLNHFTFVSTLLLPVLRLNLMLPLRFQGLGTGGWLDLARQALPAIGY